MIQEDLEAAVIRILQLGRDRCGPGFGKYPLGVRDAVGELIPLVGDNREIRERLKAFDERLKW